MNIALAAQLVIFGLCGIIAITDSRRGIIPDWCNLSIAICGAVIALSNSMERLEANALDAVIVIALFAALRSGYRRLRHRNGLGLGDVKFLGAATFCVGMSGVHIVILIACALGLAEIAIRRLKGEVISGTTHLRFGPHLGAGLAIVLLVSSNFGL